ncbi:hypothetical protein [Treponema sp. R80B11-R83G3]
MPGCSGFIPTAKAMPKGLYGMNYLLCGNNAKVYEVLETLRELEGRYKA